MDINRLALRAFPLVIIIVKTNIKNSIKRIAAYKTINGNKKTGFSFKKINKFYFYGKSRKVTVINPIIKRA